MQTEFLDAKAPFAQTNKKNKLILGRKEGAIDNYSRVVYYHNYVHKNPHSMTDFVSRWADFVHDALVPLLCSSLSECVSTSQVLNDLRYIPLGSTG